MYQTALSNLERAIDDMKCQLGCDITGLPGAQAGCHAINRNLPDEMSALLQTLSVYWWKKARSLGIWSHAG